MEQYSDDELLVIISNGKDSNSPYYETNLPGLYDKARDEWRIRQQQKVFDTQNEYNKNILKENRRLVYATIALAIITFVATALQLSLLQQQIGDNRKIESSRLMFDLAKEIRTGDSSSLIYAVAVSEKPLLKESGGKFSDEELDNYLVKYELLYKAYEEKLITKDMLSIAFGYDIVRAYQNKEIMKFINDVRSDNKDSALYRDFIKLAQIFSL